MGGGGPWGRRGGLGGVGGGGGDLGVGEGEGGEGGGVQGSLRLPEGGGIGPRQSPGSHTLSLFIYIKRGTQISELRSREVTNTRVRIDTTCPWNI